MELVVGYWSGSMALLADGWHMGTHAGALGLTALAYWFARTRAPHRAFTFGTGKVHALAGYTSALLLGLVALSMLYESVDRLLHPAPIRYREALGMAVLGLVVNLACLETAGPRPRHDHDQDDEPGDCARPRPATPATHDHSHRAAVLHVAGRRPHQRAGHRRPGAGRVEGWGVLDPADRLRGRRHRAEVGVGLSRAAGRQLLDATSSEKLESQVRGLLESIDDVRVAGHPQLGARPRPPRLHRLLVTANPRDTAHYRALHPGPVPARPPQRRGRRPGPPPSMSLT